MRRIVLYTCIDQLHFKRPIQPAPQIENYDLPDGAENSVLVATEAIDRCQLLAKLFGGRFSLSRYSYKYHRRSSQVAAGPSGQVTVVTAGSTGSHGKKG